MKYRVGQKIRRHKDDFRGTKPKGCYNEGWIVKIDHFVFDKYHIYYEITKCVLYSHVYDSWVGTVVDFFSDNDMVEILEEPKQTRLIFNTKPWWVLDQERAMQNSKK